MSHISGHIIYLFPISLHYFQPLFLFYLFISLLFSTLMSLFIYPFLFLLFWLFLSPFYYYKYVILSPFLYIFSHMKKVNTLSLSLSLSHILFLCEFFIFISLLSIEEFMCSLEFYFGLMQFGFVFLSYYLLSFL